jgi:hypothetical protein
VNLVCHVFHALREFTGVWN